MTAGQARVLLLVPTGTYRADAFMDAAQRLNVGVDIAVTVASERESVLARADNPDFLTLDFGDPERAVATAVAFARKHGITAVVAVDDQATVAAAAVAEALGTPCNPVEATRAAQNKHLMRTRLSGAPVQSPAFERVSVDDDPERIAHRVAYPCVLKPLHLAASRGVIRADTPEQFIAAFRRIVVLLQRDDVPRDGDAERAILIEQFVPGREVAVEGLLADGELLTLAVFDKPDPLDGPFFEETLYVTPSGLSDEEQRAVTDCVARAADALGLRHGPVHAEVRLNDAGAWLIEVAARSIGGLCSRALRFGAGMSLEELIIRHAVGLPIDSYERERRPAGVYMIPTPRAGVLRDIQGLEDARAIPGVEDVALTAHVGQSVEPLPEDGHYLGFIFARAATPEDVDAALRAAYAQLTFDIRP